MSEEAVQPILAEVRHLPAVRDEAELPVRATSPAVQAAAVAATTFVAGAATVALMHRRKSRPKPARGRRGKKQRVDVLSSRSFLVDVHLIDR